MNLPNKQTCNDEILNFYIREIEKALKDGRYCLALYHRPFPIEVQNFLTENNYRFTETKTHSVHNISIFFPNYPD